MADATTIATSSGRRSRRDRPAVDSLALAVIWSADEPNRLGEILWIPPGSPQATLVFGRGSRSGPRVEFIRQRPGANEPRGPTISAVLSREQLRIGFADGRLRIENIGRRALLRNGAPVKACEIVPGDVIELERTLAFVCVRRPASLPAPEADSPIRAFSFGEADALGLVGETPSMWQLRQQVAFVAGRNTHVLVVGPSGAGKELVTSALHHLSARGRRQLVSRSAATFPETLIDAELFGNVRDYPNPGMRDRPGLIGEADGTTLFLDEIGELPTDLQAHLLRVLDRGEYQRLGEEAVRHSNFRLIAATNRRESSLKHDLFARLRIRLHCTGLNDRREDIPLVVRHLMRTIARNDQTVAQRYFPGANAESEPRVDPELMRALVQHAYTTHVRELESLLWEAMTHGSAQQVELPDSVASQLRPAVLSDVVDPQDLPAEVIREALERHGGVQNKVWPELGLKNRHQLARLMRKHGIGSSSEDSDTG